MKVQITVDDELWRRAKAEAALRGVNLGDFVGEAIGGMLAEVTHITGNRKLAEKLVPTSPTGGTKECGGVK